MPTDPLRHVLRLRCGIVATERTNFAAALEAERAASAALDAIKATIRREIAAASAPAADDTAVEALGPWLSRARTTQAAATATLERAEAATARARATLAVARTAEESIRTLVEARAAAVTARAARQTQAALDEAALRLHSRARLTTAQRYGAQKT